SSSTSYRRYSSSTTRPHGYSLPAVPRQEIEVTPLSSRTSVQRTGSTSPQLRTPSSSSDGSKSPKTGVGAGLPSLAGTTGSASRVPVGPSRTVAVAGCGVGQIIGHIALDIASRIRCPRGNTHEVTCSSSASAPGPSGVGGGASAADDRPAAD